MNLATYVTLVRVALIPVGVVLLLATGVPGNYLLALGVFILALVTDCLDGYLARKFNMVTAFGGYLDGVADKLLTLLYFVHLQHAGLYPLWLLQLAIARMFIVTSLRSYLISHVASIGELKAGKWQGILIALSLMLGIVALAARAGQAPWLEADALATWTAYTMYTGVALSLVFSPRAAIRYAKQALSGLEKAKNA